MALLRTPEWKDGPRGVRVLFEPRLTEAMSAGPRYAAAAREKDPDVDWSLFFVIGVASVCIRDWSGVQGGDGEEPAPYSRENLAELISQEPAVHDWLVELVAGQVMDLLLEKNASRLSAGGTSPTEGQNTASTARKPARSARIRKTSRTPSPVSTSGD